MVQLQMHWLDRRSCRVEIARIDIVLKFVVLVEVEGEAGEEQISRTHETNRIKGHATLIHAVRIGDQCFVDPKWSDGRSLLRYGGQYGVVESDRDCTDMPREYVEPRMRLELAALAIRCPA